MQSVNFANKMILPLQLLLLSTFLISGCSTVSEGSLAPKESTAWQRCGTSTKVPVTAAKPTITVSYTEPATIAGGRPLINLAYTTIHYDIGKGPVIAKIVPATRFYGGGTISQTITIPVKDRQEVQAAICVTATDLDGRESPPSP